MCLDFRWAVRLGEWRPSNHTPSSPADATTIVGRARSKQVPKSSRVQKRCLLARSEGLLDLQTARTNPGTTPSRRSSSASPRFGCVAHSDLALHGLVERAWVWLPVAVETVAK